MNFLKKIFARRNRKFVSQEDLFLQQLAKKFPKPSASQQHEINKEKRVSHLRDHVVNEEKDSSIWRGF